MPRPPTEELSPSAEKEATEAHAQEKKSPPVSKTGPAKSPKEQPPVETFGRVKVGKPMFTSCRDQEGRTVPACDPIPIDELVVPHIKALERCPAAERAEGALSLGMKINFESGKIERLSEGKSTTITTAVAKELVGCAERELASVSLANVPHNHTSYTAFYPIEIAPPAEVVAQDEPRTPPSDEAITPASGMATVAWVAARVRVGPAKDAKEVARLAAGARVKVLGRQGDWYKVQWDAKGSEGWVFKSAIGM